MTLGFTKDCDFQAFLDEGGGLFSFLVLHEHFRVLKLRKLRTGEVFLFPILASLILVFRASESRASEYPGQEWKTHFWLHFSTKM